jgi:hypothetical protein
MTKYRLSQQPLPVTLTPEEVQQTLDFVARMREDKVANNVTDRMFDLNNTSEGINIIGHLGEMAVGKVLNLPVDMEVRTHGDDGNDLMLNNTGIQVKTSELQKLIFNAPRLFKSEIAILAQFVGADKRNAQADPRFVLWGWVDRKEFLTSYYTQNFGYGDRLVLDAPYLHPLDSLLEEYGAN